MKHLRQNIPRFVLTIFVAVVGGFVFHILNISVPWLLGPMMVMFIGKNIFRVYFVFSYHFQNIGMGVIGYTIGLAMTLPALVEMGRQLPYMVLFTLLLMVLCTGIAYIIAHLSGNDYRTSLLGSIPGGLTQVIALAQETKGVHFTIVTVTQVFRLMIIVITMPLVVMIPALNDNQAGNASAGSSDVTQTVQMAELFPDILFFIIAGIAFTILCRVIRFPTAYLIGPILGTITLQLAGLNGPELPTFIMNIAQLLIGTHVGLLLDTSQIVQKGRVLVLAFVSGVLLVAGAIGISFLLTVLEDVSEATALLSLAPGGMDQMSIIAHEIVADLSVVSGYQLFRTLFIFFVVPPVLKMLFRRSLPARRVHES